MNVMNKHASDNTIAAHSSQTSGEQDDVLDLAELFSTLWRGKWLIALFSVLFLVAGGYYVTRVAVPSYTSTAVIVLDTQISQFTSLDSVVSNLSGESEQVNTEVEILKSRRLMGKVVDHMNLVADPEFNAELLPPGLKKRTIMQVKSLLGIKEAEPAPIPEELRERILRDSVITALLRQVRIRNVAKSLVFQISITTDNALKSAQIADGIAEQYILDQINIKFEETQKITTWLTERVAQFQQELENAEAEVAAFSQKTDLISPERLLLLEIQLKERRDLVASLQKELQLRETLLTRFEAAKNGGAQDSLMNDDSFMEALSELRDQVSGQPFSVEQAEQISRQLQDDIYRGKTQLSSLMDSEEALATQLVKQNNDLIQLQQLKRESEAVRLLYEYFLGRLKETAAQQGTQQADSRLLSPAVVPNRPSAPKSAQLVVIFAVLGAFIGSAVVVWREMRSTGLRSAQDLEQRFGYSVLGQIPMAPVRNRNKLFEYLAEKSSSAVAESFRNLRTSVMMSNVDTPPKVIISTSCVPGEGKTTNSLGLAQNFAGMGKKVLLMEGDIRRRTLDVYFPDMKNRKGLISVMMGESTMDEAVIFDPTTNVHVLGGEQSKMNAADVFASDKFRQFVDKLRGDYDLIIIDCPPVLVVPDARILATVADSVLFSVKWNSTSIYHVEESLRTFHASGQKITGFILGQIDTKWTQSYGKYSTYTSMGGDYYHN